MKRLFRILVLFLLVGLFVILAGFLALAAYYRNHFPVNTWINGVYCTGKTVEQVNQELVDQTSAPGIVLIEADGTKWELDMERADICPDYTEALYNYLSQNRTVFWMDNLQNSVSVSVDATKYIWQEENLRDCFEALAFVQRENAREEGVFIQDTEQGFLLQDGNSMRLDPEKSYTYLEACLKKGEALIDLAAGDCYVTLPDTEQDKMHRLVWRELKSYLESRIVYDMGTESIPLTPDVLSDFLETENGVPMLDEGNHLVIREEAVRDWVEALAAVYDTCDTEKEFQSTRGDLVNVKYVTYGTRLDVEAEVTFLMGALTGEGDQEAQSDPVHVPAYLQQGFVRGLDDIGDTYIEVDMTQQHMYYYMDGELVLDTDVVTGDTSKRRGTPQGINFVYNKQRNRVLRGPDYASPVKYWMPVKGAVGIHDADWRSKFGGQIYKTNGSHGCINTPPKIMGELYDMVEIGTPVIMFY